MHKTIEYFLEKVASVFIGIGTLGLWNYVYRTTHREMIEESEDVKTIKLAVFSEFKQAFDSVVWNYYTTQHAASLFTKDDRNEFHASIIRFGDVGYVMTTYGLIRAIRYKNRYIKRNFTTQQKPIIF